MNRQPWRARPPRETLSWVARSVGPGSQVVAVRLLALGGWHANHVVTVVDRRGCTHRLVLRRWARQDWEIHDPDFTAIREVHVLAALERSTIPAPRLVAADPDADVCDVPSLLITRLKGHPPLRVAAVEPFVRQLAEMLVRIHHVDAGAFELPGYHTYVDMKLATIPVWLRDPPTWQRALSTARKWQPRPQTRFIHRDYHPENSLWSRGRLTGIVDWTQASIGSPEVDVGHMRWNLVASYGQAVADRFQELYENKAGQTLTEQPWWDLITLLDLVLDVAGPLPSAELARLEAYAAATLAKLS